MSREQRVALRQAEYQAYRSPEELAEDRQRRQEERDRHWARVEARAERNALLMRMMF
jgi:hypothetical protein